jgi:aminopeptidase N
MNIFQCAGRLLGRPVLFLPRSASIAACLALFAVYGFTQETYPDRPRTYDVKNYTIRVSFDTAKKIVYGDTTVSLTPLNNPLSQVDLDAVDLIFTGVALDPGAKTLRYRVSKGKVNVQLDHAYKPGEIAAIRFKYRIVQPKKGIYFIPAETDSGKLAHSAQIWTQNEPEDGRYWFPSFDFPSDKAASEEYITAAKGETVIGNGELADKTDNANGTTTFHYRMDVPHSTYLISFVVGDFTRLADQHGNVPLSFYAYKDRERVAAIAFAPTKNMMAAYEKLTGVEFPYKKYDQIMLSGFQEFDGMENITATTLADSQILFADYPFGKPLVEDLVSHELAHSWFGDLVTCKNWSELWLNEGFATYMEAASREMLHDRDSYINKLQEDRDEYIAAEGISRNHHALQNRTAKPDQSLFDVTTYQKGGVVLHMLRETVGTAAFWKGVNLYLERHKFDNVVSSDLEAAMEEASGQDLKWFFDQWIYAPGYPMLEVTKNYDAAGVLHLTVDQVQKEDGATPAAFRFSLDVEVGTANGPVTQTVQISKRSETFDIKLSSAPTGLVVDRQEKVILKAVKIKQ